VTEMMSYLRIAAAMFAVAWAVSVSGAVALLRPGLAIPVSVFRAGGQAGRACGLVGVAAAAAFAAFQSPSLAAYYGLFAGTGIPLGWAISRRWTYGWAVTVLAAATMAVTIGVVLPIWSVWQEAARGAIDTLMTAALQQGGENGSEIRAEYLPYLEWLKAHVMEVEFGLMLWPALACACIAVEAGPAG